jgi:small-conductance mechanosensitive channel
MPTIFVSPTTIIALVIGIIITVFYLRYMWLVLQRVARTLDDPDDGKSDGFAHSFIGAIVAVIASSLAIVAYGLAPQFLYLGIALALASPIAVAYTFKRELDD